MLFIIVNRVVVIKIIIQKINNIILKETNLLIKVTKLILIKKTFLINQHIIQ